MANTWPEEALGQMVFSGPISLRPARGPPGGAIIIQSKQGQEGVSRTNTLTSSSRLLISCGSFLFILLKLEGRPQGAL